MASDEEYLHMLYFYNALIEFVYFTIIYTERHGFISISTLSKHVKFFKTEVEELLLSFWGNTFEEKICQFFTFLQFFKVKDNRVLFTKKTNYFKESIFADLTLSKTTDLVLRGCTIVREVCKNLNSCSVISIDQKQLLNLLQKSTHFSIKGNILSLNHFHGILGLEHYSCDSIIYYFLNILQYVPKLSLKEISYHIDCLLSCGTSHIMSIMCVLYCSEHFHFKNGFMSNTKNEKCQKQNCIDLSLCQNVSETILNVEEIVHLTEGTKIINWTGEICYLKEGFGAIYCIIEILQGHSGVFILYFNHDALKIISEVVNLKRYLCIRDKVQFDATYNKDKNYWIANKIKILNSNRLDYDEYLFSELERKTEGERESCMKNALHYYNSAQNFRKCFNISCNHFTPNENCVCSKSIITENSNFMNEKKLDAVQKRIVRTLDDSEIVPNLLFIDYFVVFGYVILLTLDKGIAVFQKNNKIYNILFLKNSLNGFYNSVNLLYVGQKIFAVVPFIDKVDVTAAASLVYGLNQNETEKFTTPLAFARYFLTPSLGYKFSGSCDVIRNLINLNYYNKSLEMSCKTQEFHELVMSFCVSSDSVTRLSAFWSLFIKEFTDDDSENDVRLLFIKFAGIVKKNMGVTKRFQAKYKSVRKTPSYSLGNCCAKKQNLCLVNDSSNLAVNDEKKGTFPDNLVYLKSGKGSSSSLSSYKSLDSVTSSDTYYSCQSINADTVNSGDKTEQQVNQTFIACDEHKSICISLDSVLSSEIYSCASGETCLPSINEIEHHQVNLSSVFCEQSLTFSPGAKNEVLIVVEDFDEHQASKSQIKNTKHRKEERLRQLHLKSLPIFKPLKKQKRRLYIPPAKKSNYCDKNPSKVIASLSLMTESLFFFDINIDDQSILLPLPKQIVPPRFMEKMKLRSCYEAKILPHPITNLSSIFSINMSSV